MLGRGDGLACSVMCEADSCISLTRARPPVHVRYGLAGAESEGGSEADQPGSAKARSAAPH